MKTKEKNEFVRITTLGIATALIGSMVGPGFSSGNELMQFFGNFGYIGVAGVLVCETLVAVTVIMAMRLAQKMDTPYFDKVVSPMGDGFFSKLLRLFSMIVTLGFMIACIPAMTAVGATVLEQQFGMNFQVAAIVYTCFVAVPVLFGTEGFTKSMSAFIPFVVIAGVVICLCVCMQPQAKAIDFQSLQVTNGLMKNWFLAALLYFSYNTTVGIAVVVPLGQKVKDNRKIIRGGILGAGALAAMICVCVIAIIRNYGNVYQAELPTLVMARKLHLGSGMWLYVCGSFQSRRVESAEKINCEYELVPRTGDVACRACRKPLWFFCNCQRVVSGYRISGICNFVDSVLQLYEFVSEKKIR